MRIPQDHIRNFALSMSAEELDETNRVDHERYEKEYAQFIEGYKTWICYICKKSLKTYSSKNFCLHYLLKPNWFEKNDFPKIFQKWSYFHISSYLRWVANQERYASSINNLIEEKDPKKKFEYTIKWKNIEWTFSCALTDFVGHIGVWNFPHYHFQMRIWGRQFINYGEYHIPFSDYDLFIFDSIDTWLVRHSYWYWGLWIQESIEKIDRSVNPFENLKRTEVSDEAQFKIHTTITWDISQDLIAGIIEESKKTGQTIASLVSKLNSDKFSVSTIIEPIDDIPNIAARDPKYRK